MNKFIAVALVLIGLLPETVFPASVSLSSYPVFQAVDANGNPCSGCKLYTYSTGTTTPQVTYQNSGGVSVNTNPVVLDSAGSANVWLDNSLTYREVLKTADGTTLWTTDGITGAGVPAFPVPQNTFGISNQSFPTRVVNFDVSQLTSGGFCHGTGGFSCTLDLQAGVDHDVILTQHAGQTVQQKIFATDNQYQMYWGNVTWSDTPFAAHNVFKIQGDFVDYGGGAQIYELPVHTDILVGRASTDTLTHKTISGADNTITNIPLPTAVTGTLPTTHGGTGLTTVGTSGQLLSSTGSALQFINPPSVPTCCSMPVATGLVAGSTTGTAAVLVAGYNVVTSTAGGGNYVQLPAAAIGTVVYVWNRAGSALNLVAPMGWASAPSGVGSPQMDGFIVVDSTHYNSFLRGVTP